MRAWKQRGNKVKTGLQFFVEEEEKEGTGRNGGESLNQSSKVLEWLRGIVE